MDLSLAEVAAGWPLAASLAAIAVRGVHGGRRRAALNECLHELRRPLQVLSLTAGGEGVGGAAAGRVESSLRLAARAVEQLDREINGGGPGTVVLAPVLVEPLLRETLARWRARAELRGGSVQLCWRAGAAVVAGDSDRLEQALDNLLANAVEHGGPRIVIEARRRPAVVELSVVDSGVASRRPGPPRRERAVAGLSGRRRHGHGLRVVRRIAAEHGGEFELRCGSGRTEALLRIPVAASLEVAR